MTSRYPLRHPNGDRATSAPHRHGCPRAGIGRFRDPQPRGRLKAKEGSPRRVQPPCVSTATPAAPDGAVPALLVPPAPPAPAVPRAQGEAISVGAAPK